MALRAYIHHDDVAPDSSTQLTTQELSALGLDVITLHDSEDPQKEARRLVQEWGYPLDREDCVYPFDCRQGANNSDGISAFFDQLIEFTHKSDFAIPCEVAAILDDSSIYFEVEDAKSKKWIRVHSGPNQLYRVHAGLKVRVYMTDENRHHHGTLFLKDGLRSLNIIPGADLDDHSVRQAFLAKIGI